MSVLRFSLLGHVRRDQARARHPKLFIKRFEFVGRTVSGSSLQISKKAVLPCDGDVVGNGIKPSLWKCALVRSNTPQRRCVLGLPISHDRRMPPERDRR
jgi:hypothetical protein